MKYIALGVLVFVVVILLVVLSRIKASNALQGRGQRSLDHSIPEASNALQGRAQRFLDRPIPEGMAYVPGSISEGMIRVYAATGSAESIREDEEMMELLEICVVEGEAAAQTKSGKERAFFEESAAILRAIQLEIRKER
ncbi:hypothetical protein ACFL1X_04530 [Candidatus Hydrogenedentota bacterium]